MKASQKIKAAASKHQRIVHSRKLFLLCAMNEWEMVRELIEEEALQPWSEPLGALEAAFVKFKNKHSGSKRFFRVVSNLAGNHLQLFTFSPHRRSKRIAFTFQTIQSFSRSRSIASDWEDLIEQWGEGVCP